MKYSVLMPAFKQRYLYEAINSCLSQYDNELELIIIDDASPEDLKSVVDNFTDDRIKYYRNDKNCGALTTGISVCLMPQVIMSSVWVTMISYFLIVWRSIPS